MPATKTSKPGPRFRFFGGKGGVGKTTCAAATALGLAGGGERVLLVSTDPAHSLGDALAVRLGAAPKRVAARLFAVELDADAALQRWLDERLRTIRIIAERGTFLDQEDLDRFLRLSLPGVDELVGLVEVVRLADEGKYGRVVIDTAPTGHTLRLLQMPGTLVDIARVLDHLEEKHRVLAESLVGGHAHDAADALIEEIDERGRLTGELLRDPERAVFTWVSLPEPMSVAETEDGVRALDSAGITVPEIIVNRLTPPPPDPCALCSSRRQLEAAAVRQLEQGIGRGRQLLLLEARDQEPRGLVALRKIAESLAKPFSTARLAAAPKRKARARAGPRTGLRLSAHPDRRLLLFGGKGGVGKSTCAAAAALAIAADDPTRRILLLSTDPAHSLADVLGVPLGDDERSIPGAAGRLRARELDALHGFEQKRAEYREAVDELFDGLRRGSLDASYDRRAMRELIDLAPPGLDELFAILAIMDALVAPKPRYDLVVADTAPTGHTLRLLAMPAAAHDWTKALMAILLKYRKVVGLGSLARDVVELSQGLRRLGELLVDPRCCRFVAVTRAAELPRVETERLLEALGRLSVAVDAVIVNAVTPAGCRRCRRAAAVEERHVQKLPRRCAILTAPAVAPPPRGPAALLAFAATWKLSK